MFQRFTPINVLAFMLLIPPSFAYQNPTWTRQLGTPGTELATDVGVSSTGELYACGFVNGSLAGAHQGSADIWVAKFDCTGHPAWIQQFGTSGTDSALKLVVDPFDNFWVTGTVEGNLFAPPLGLSDVFLAKFDVSGNLVEGHQFGTGSFDSTYGMELDASGDVFLCGSTQGNLGSAQMGSGDAWIARLSPSGNPIWIRQFGSDSYDTAQSIVLDGLGGLFVSGYTDGDFAGPVIGQSDIWLGRFDLNGNLLWTQKVGSDQADLTLGMVCNSAGTAFLSGSTAGDFAGPSLGEYDFWISAWDHNGTQLWANQFGTAQNDISYRVALDGIGSVYLTGETEGSFAAPNLGFDDVCVATFDELGNSLWSIQFGTTADDLPWGIACTPNRGPFVVGGTMGSLAGTHQGILDIWLARLDPNIDSQTYCSPAIDNSTGWPGRIHASGTSEVNANHVLLTAEQLPPNMFGYFLASQSQGFVPAFAGSQGNLCLGGFVGRFNEGTQIYNSAEYGAACLELDLATIPLPQGHVAVQPGETWHFQSWYRDRNPGHTSNLTDAVTVTFW